MPRKHIIILSLLVIVPLVAFFVLGQRLLEADKARTQQQFESLLEANLAGIDGSVADYFASLEQRLLRAEVDPDDVESIRAFARSEPLVEQVIVLDEDGMPVYPVPPLSNAEANYLLKVAKLIEDRELTRQNLQEQTISQLQQQAIQTFVPLGNRPVKVTIHKQSQSNTSITPRTTQDYGWRTWNWDSGRQVIHWRVLDRNRTLVVGLQRARWMADIIGVLPESSPEIENRTAPAQIRLINANGEVVYLWGANTDLPKDQQPVTQLNLSPPLRSWQLQHFGPAEPLSFGGSSTLVSLLGAGGLLSVGLFGLALYLSREIGRQTREARQRVSFVNQVSHELKTPLTNIRMYADLLEQDLERIDPDDPKAQSHLSVITSESGRLSRLINNVLTFARLNRNAAQSKTRPSTIDEVITTVVEQFKPSLDQLEIDVTLDLDATEEVAVDVDAFEQMLGNLISNVEKYAADGKHLRIASRYKNGISTIDVSDAGPGISPSFAKRIFEPFERASDHIVSATGTGIGLGITRSLAQRNGGDLVLRESSMGASFRLTLATPPWEG